MASTQAFIQMVVLVLTLVVSLSAYYYHLEEYSRCRPRSGANLDKEEIAWEDCYERETKQEYDERTIFEELQTMDPELLRSIRICRARATDMLNNDNTFNFEKFESVLNRLDLESDVVGKMLNELQQCAGGNEPFTDEEVLRERFKCWESVFAKNCAVAHISK